MNRWHKLRHGRIVASCECVTGDAAEVLLDPSPLDLIVSDAQWRGTYYRRPLMHLAPPKRTLEQQHADMRRRAQEIADGL